MPLIKTAAQKCPNPTTCAYMDAKEFAESRQAVNQERKATGMPDNFQRKVKAKHGQTIVLTFKHVDGDDGNHYERTKAQVSSIWRPVA